MMESWDKIVGDDWPTFRDELRYKISMAQKVGWI